MKEYDEFLPEEERQIIPPKEKKPLKERVKRFLLKFTLYFFGITIFWVIVLRFIPVFFTLTMLSRSMDGLFDKNGEATIYYDWTPIEDISPDMPIAVIASEDQNFPTHNGFDFMAIERAMERNKTSKTKYGASTISQQVAKNVFLWQGRSWLRKGLEVYFTFLIETIWSKKRIMEVYLNVAETGKNTFGVQAAAKRFYKKNASQLTSSQSARIAAVLPNPIVYSIKNPTSHTLLRQNQIAYQMRILGGRSYWNTK